MPFSATETDMNDFTFGQDDADIPIPTVPYAYRSSRFDEPGVDSYFFDPEDGANWMPDELWDEVSPTGPGPPTAQSGSASMSGLHGAEESTYPHSTKLGTTSNDRASLTKIAEYQAWGLTSNESKYETADHHSTQLTVAPVLTSNLPSNASLPSSAPSGGDRWTAVESSQPSGFSDSQSHPKRRRSLPTGGSPERRLSSEEPRSEGQPEPTAKNKLAAKLLTRGPAVPHSVIERRYRENLNSKISMLDQTLSLTRISVNEVAGIEDEEDPVRNPGKTRKSDVLVEAMRYVKQAEMEKAVRTNEIDFMRERVTALEKLVRCGDCAVLKHLVNQQTGANTDF